MKTYVYENCQGVWTLDTGVPVGYLERISPHEVALVPFDVSRSSFVVGADVLTCLEFSGRTYSPSEKRLDKSCFIS